jgi:hypothetical protein
MSQQHIELVFKALPLYDTEREDLALSVLSTLIADDLPMRAVDGGMHERGANAFYFILDAVIFNLHVPAFHDATIKLVKFLVSRVDFDHLRRVKREGGKLKRSATRLNLFEFILLNCSFATAESGPDGLPQIMVDFGRMLNELSETRKPKITVANRNLPIEAARYFLTVPLATLEIPPPDSALLVEALREG